MNVLHENLEIVELLGCVDQVDISNLAGVEATVRHLQYVEHEVKKKHDARTQADGSDYFSGRGRRAGGAIISPELLKWVAEKAARDASVAKEIRKAGEERSLARAKAKAASGKKEGP